MKAEKRKLSVVRDNASPKNEAALSASSELASVRVDALRQFDKLVASLGGDAAALLQRARIERSPSDQGKGVIPFSQMADLFDRASTELACPDFGLRLATIQAAHGATKVLGPLDVAMRATLAGLGLNKMHRRRTLEDTPSVRGMIAAVQHLVRVVDEK